MDGPPTNHQGVVKETFTAHLQQLSPREGIPVSISSPNLVQGTLPTDWDEDGSPSTQSIRPKRASSVPRPTETPPASDVHIDLEGAKLERFRQWLHCIIIVNFDLDVGPVVQDVVPEIALSAAERQNIAFSSFPDTSNIQSGTEIHSFRLRHGSPLSSDPDFFAPDGYVYGYCLFHQQRDQTSRRGYTQRSLVLLTHLPFPRLFTDALLICKPLFLRYGVDMFESACHNISNWPPPTRNSTVELGLLGSVLHAELPRSVDEQQMVETSSFGASYDSELHLLASLPPADPPAISLFAALLPSLWSLWECLILSEPILVYSPSPALTSAAVWWLRDLSRPIPFSGDFRPYFTMHDTEKQALINKLQPPPGLVLGTTNPFVYEECRHWPHTLSLGWGDAIGARGTARESKSILSLGPPPGWRTPHKRYISKDRNLLKRLDESLHSGDREAKYKASALIRQHFHARTTAILVPLNRYLTSLIPALSYSSLSTPSNSRLPRIASFNRDKFFSSLKTHGSPLPFKSAAKQQEFYQRWIDTNAFSAWLMREEKIVNAILADKVKDA